MSARRNWREACDEGGEPCGGGANATTCDPPRRPFDWRAGEVPPDRVLAIDFTAERPELPVWLG